MPTYVCHTRPGLLDPDRRAELARRMTAVHAAATGAPSPFVQVLFRETEPAGHFVGGRAADRDAVFVHGHIRAGRTEEAKHRLLLGLRDEVVAVAAVPVEAVWVYLSELAPADMVEFGRVLPDPGHEPGWIAGLPAPLRDRFAEPDG